MPIDELVKNLADHVAALATRVERGAFQSTRIANASEETNAMALTQMQETRAAYEKVAVILAGINAQLAVLVDNIKDAEKKADDAKVAAIDNKHALEHLSGSFPLMPLDVDDTDKKIGRVVRGAFKHAWVRAAALLTGGGVVGTAWHWLIDHFHIFGGK
jgi:hypothetical protein